MEKFCKFFDFREQLEEDDLYLPSEILSLIKSAKNTGGIVVLNGSCYRFPDNPRDCDYIINTGKISVLNDIAMGLNCSDYKK